MCGRITLHDTEMMRDFLLQHFHLDVDVFEGIPSYNIAPGHKLWSLIYDGTKFRLGTIPWGLMVPGKDKDYFNINAKRESLKTYRYFKDLYQKKRAIIILNGYYEWQDQGDYKQPFYIYSDTASIMTIAALWDKKDASFGLTLMTQPPMKDLENIHHRMPVLMSAEEGIAYLKTGNLPDMCTQSMTYHEVSHMVNSPKHNDPTLIQPMDDFMQ